MYAKCLPILGLLFALFMLIGVSACNTIKGAGEDIQAAGGAIENTAKKTKTY